MDSRNHVFLVHLSVPNVITNSCSSTEIPTAQAVSEPIIQVPTGHMPRGRVQFSNPSLLVCYKLDC